MGILVSQTVRHFWRIVTSSGMSLSMASEFIDNRHDDGSPEAGSERRKQDCELKTFARLVPQLKRSFPQTRLCIASDALNACGEVLQTCRENKWNYVLTFKPGSLPAVWEDFQSLLTACPEQVLRIRLPDGTNLEYRWINGLSYEDDQGRRHTFNAIPCHQHEVDGHRTFAWLTDFPVTAKTVDAMSQNGGRNRRKIEHAGFNSRKNVVYELEHVSVSDEALLKCFYWLLQIAHMFLLQIAHMILQLVETGSLLRPVGPGSLREPPQQGP